MVKMSANESPIRKLVTWTAYPGTIVLGFFLQQTLLGMGQSLLIASYGAVVICSVVITGLEFAFPARPEWLGGKREWTNDFVFMGLVQLILPKLLSLLVLATAVDLIAANEASGGGIWPHHWPIAAQTALMLVTAEFCRYWMHVVGHNWEPFWRLHAVHHAPHKLYWLNVARFHPIEKSFQFLVDTLPFILMGVSKEVMMAYLVFYAINGFYQHCNIDVRLGVLNYIISGPELHRWHHSMLIEESNTNYGNNLIIWDIVFGTYFMPKDRVVGDLGLINRNYPDSFIGQMKTPFVKGLDKLTT